MVKFAISQLRHVLDEMVLFAPLQVHRVTRNKQYVRQIIAQRKATPFLTCSLIHSFNVNIEKVAKSSERVAYPYLLILGEKDSIVDNAGARAWHSKTVSKQKDIKLMAGSFHELSKEPNNGTMFESVLKFMVSR